MLSMAAWCLPFHPVALVRGQQPTFRSGVDLVLVEVIAVDRAGAPALIPASQFEVRIDGRPRRVVSAELMRYASDLTSHAAPRSPERPLARNDWPETSGTPGQTFVIAIDVASLSAGDGAGVVRAARRFVEQLPAADAVGVVALPRGTVLRPTTDRTAVRASLGGVVGLQALRANPFHLTAAEIVDINAEAEQMAALGTVTVSGRGRGQVIAVQDVLRQVQTRECRGMADQVCLQEIVMEAESQARELEDQVSESLAGLNALLGLLVEYPGRKTVVLLSAGMPVSDRPGGWHRDSNEARMLGRAAAVANATVYAIHLDVGYRNVYSAETRLARPAVSLARERDVQQRLLADFAYSSGGALFDAPVDAGENGLARVRRETSAFYALGVAPEPRDLDGRTHELRVSVADRNVTVRSRRFVVLRPAP
jgi:VWFA-related protein